MVTISILLLPSFSFAEKNTSQKQIVLKKTLYTDTLFLAQKKSQLLKPFPFGKLRFKKKLIKKLSMVSSVSYYQQSVLVAPYF